MSANHIMHVTSFCELYFVYKIKLLVDAQVEPV